MATISALSSATSVGMPTPKPQPNQHQEQTQHAGADKPSDGPQYLSPVVNVDPNTGIAVLVVRDTTTGEELSQYPTRMAIDEYSKKLKANEANPSQSQPVAASADSAQDRPADQKSA